MTELALKIKERITREGPITFEAFMDMALYHPALGYYTSEATEIGKGGDFYTSPHLNRAFGMMLGKQVEEFSEFMGRPPEFSIIEMGGGRGHLAKDILDSLKDTEIYRNLRYLLIELNPRLAEKQKELLSAHASKVEWAGSLSGIKGLKGVLLSNELLDSFPVHLIEIEDEPGEVYVSFEGGRFVEIKGPLSTPLLGDYIREHSIALPPEGEIYKTEINLRMRDWLMEVSSALEEGFVLTVDYGYPAWEYYSEERPQGTLLCYRGHQTGEDPYEEVGNTDITAHVNFSALKKWGQEAGLRALGFCRQGPYLVSLGIDEAIEELRKQGGLPPLFLEQVKGLIMPGTMGDTHKVMVQYKGPEMQFHLRGFKLSNKINTL